jgi:hypothetical protein
MNGARWQLVSRSSDNPNYHEDSYVVSYPDGSMTQVSRQVPKRVGKTQKDRRMHGQG